MDLDELRSEIRRVTKKIINRVYRVSNMLGSGFLEKVYENALAIELKQSALQLTQQYPVNVIYNRIVLNY